MSSIYVSGIKNKMGFCQFSTFKGSLRGPTPQWDKSALRASDINSGNPIEVNHEFLYWFSGFTDAEGNFLVTLDRQYIRLRFKIQLHIDDVKVLEIIQSNLKIGRVTTETSKNRCSFIVENFSEVKQLCSIFNNFPLHTSKKLDFKSFYEVVLIKAINKKISSADIDKVIYIKNSMNAKRKIFTYDITKSQIIINPNWFIGFLEGEGTFGIKTGSSMYLQVAQKSTSQECLNAITQFLTDLSINTMDLQDNRILPINVISTVNVRTNVISLVVTSIDALYYYILPLLDTSKMYTHKAIDFKLWRMALLLKIQGYYFLPEGKNLFLDIADILNKRYSTNSSTGNINEVIDNIIERFQDILKKDSPFDVKLNIPHVENVRKFSVAKRSLSPNIVYIYTKEGMFKGSPFASFSKAHKALGLKPSSNTCNRYIDTNRLYKNKYIFSSNPIDRASRG